MSPAQPSLTFLFPGQGAQKPGMGESLSQAHREASRVFHSADQILGFELSRLCFEGPADELSQTENTQPALFTTCVAALAVLLANGIKPAAAAGHSVGEYAALVSAGALDFESALPVVRLRGELMAKAVESTPGTMAAVIGLSANMVHEICLEAEPHGIVEPSNLNAPKQTVISGEVEAVAVAMKLATERGGRAIRLDVSAPFHCSMMEPVRLGMEAAIAALPIRSPEVPVVANSTGNFVETADQIRSCLLDQLAAPVRWSDSILTLVGAGYTAFAEVGPGRVLSGLLRAIAPDASILPTGTAGDIEKLLTGQNP